MARTWLIAFLLATFVACIRGQLVCPMCSNKYNPDSCTETQQCGVGWNYCELLVHTSDYHSVEYVCQNYADCVNHELHGCHPQINETCFYCCEDIETCKLQRDDLFKFVFPTAGPPVTTTPRTTPPPTIPTDPVNPGSSYTCPRCTDPYDHNSCTAAQTCSSNFDVCELTVNTKDSNRLNYSCQKWADCTNHETFGCQPQLKEVCTYCCSDPVTCKIQRDDLFTYVFPPETITWAPKPAGTD